MAGRLSMATKGELFAAIGDPYRASSRAARTKILDEFVAVTGSHRKHAIRLVRPKTEPLGLVRRQVHRRYGADVREALVALWETCDRLCSKRLKLIIPVLLPALERHGQLAIDEAIRERLLAVSPATRPVALRGSARCVRWPSAPSWLQLGGPAHSSGADVRRLE